MIVRSQIRVIFEIFLKFASRLVPEGWVELKISGCRYYFWTFELKLNILRAHDGDSGVRVRVLLANRTSGHTFTDDHP